MGNETKKEIFQKIQDLNEDEFLYYLEAVIFMGAVAMDVSPARFCLALAMKMPRESYSDMISDQAENN